MSDCAVHVKPLVLTKTFILIKRQKILQNSHWLSPEAYLLPAAFITSPHFRTVKPHKKLKYQCHSSVCFYGDLKNMLANYLFPSGFFFFFSFIFGYWIFSVAFIYKN